MKLPRILFHSWRWEDLKLALPKGHGVMKLHFVSTELYSGRTPL